MNLYIRPMGRSGSIVLKTPCLRRMAGQMAGFQSTPAKAPFRARFFSTTKAFADEQRPDPNRKPSGYHYNPTQPPPDPSPNPNPNPSSNTGEEPRRRLPILLIYAGALAGGLYAVNLVKLLTLPPAIPGSEVDVEFLADIKSTGDELLAEIRRNNISPDAQDWIIIGPTDFSFNDVNTPIILAGALASSAGLPYHRLLLNTMTGEIFGVIYIGDGVCGWPSVVHGGASAIILQSIMAVAAGLVKQPVAGLRESGRRLFDPAQAIHFNLNYAKKLKAAGFYFVMVTPPQDDPADLMGFRGTFVNAAILDVMPHRAYEWNIMVIARSRFIATPEPPAQVTSNSTTT
ncbi:uncharacterized protein PpBr36_09413 [Pyricularia pennisetigena]|uniref:uncharacterized protein n=1 Tax=Pyricularia pennisetigena TaxID=1578925 RepID=UPI001153EDFB|nr:uncharacterized protein PpBr36_09413 [Pyricularia pennisetigena]TLS21673.1 hypothetical protein PpBr36_09413 [Pyricularia pennisetigena]